jgi:hypothetical protein
MHGFYKAGRESHSLSKHFPYWTFDVQAARLSGMNASIDVLKRWMALDKELHVHSGGSLSVKKFAKEWGCSEKTVRRDLEVFEALGQKITRERYSNLYIYQYGPGVKYLFVHFSEKKATHCVYCGRPYPKPGQRYGENKEERQAPRGQGKGSRAGRG